MSFFAILLCAGWIAVSLSMLDTDFGFVRLLKKNCTNEKGDSSHLVHLPTHEGLASHYRQLENLWIIAQTMLDNVTIVEVPFQSRHFGGASDVSMCDIFELPSGVKCSCSPFHEVGSEQSDCALLNVMGYTWANRPTDYGLNTTNSHLVAKELDLKSTTCIAGFLHNFKFMPGYDSVLQKNPKNLHFSGRFNQKYVRLAGLVKKLFGWSEQTVYMAVHWRRGDQLTSRCTGSIQGQHDQSVNCGSGEDFIKAVESERSSHNYTHASSVPVLVASNEAQEATLLSLHSAGYLTSANITTALAPYVQLSLVDMFVLEVVLMCQATHFHYWGLSGVNSIVEDCRKSY